MNKDLLNIEFVSNEKIENICTYKTLGKVKGVFYPRNENELIAIYDHLIENKIPFKIIGNGSNLLIKNDCEFLFVCLKKMEDKIKFLNNHLYVSSSTSLAKIFRACYNKSLSGFEYLAGIPATIGGAVKMNASAFGHSTFDILENVKIYKNGHIKHLKNKQIIYSHHNTNLNDCLILSAKFKLQPKNSFEILNEFSIFAKKRGDKQPKGFSCGSVFRNPQEKSAGRLIEKCQLKGKKCGCAMISDKHANFITNLGQATFDDVKTLIELCEDEVYNKFGIKLEREVEIIE